MPASKCKVLIVDDSDDDRFLLKRALHNNDCCEVIGSAEDGQKAIDYLSGTGIYGDRERFPLPDLMLLDLKMPRVNGFEVLNWLRKQSARSLKVIVLSSSFLPEDIAQTLTLGADHYMVKTAAAETARSIATFLRSSQCPTANLAYIPPEHVASVQ
jgi:two-component system response regulator